MVLHTWSHWSVVCLTVLTYGVMISMIQGQDMMNCDSESDVIFMVDSSVSIRESNPLDNSYDNWQIIKDFIVNITMRLPVNDKIRIGVLKFSNTVDTQDVIHLGDYESRDELKAQINNLTFLGRGTNTSGAIWYINTGEDGMFQSSWDRPHVQNYGVLITDGLSNKDASKTRPYAREARLNFNTKFFTIGITKYANEDELEEIASDPIAYYGFVSKDFQKLNVLLDQMLTRLCRETPPPRAPCMDTRSDVTFLLDSSGSIGNDNWMILKKFVIGVIDSMDLANDMTRVAVIRYSTKAEVVFPLDKYFGPNATGSIAEMRRVIMDLNWVDEKTNISGALKLMRRDVLQKNNGDRPNIQNIGILISDGQSTEDINETSVQADLLKADGVQMFALGLTADIKVEELTYIASRPLSIHYLNATSIADAPTLTSRLVWGICGLNCEGDATDDASCWRNATLYGCQGNERPSWKEYKNHILLGHNYDRLENIISAEECKRLCYRDPLCRSIDYVHVFNQCAVSYTTKSQAESSFVYEPTADYYELSCRSETQKPDGDGGSNEVPDIDGDGGLNEVPDIPASIGVTLVMHQCVVFIVLMVTTSLSPW